MEEEDALPLRAAVRFVSRECFPRNESLPGVEQLIDEFIDDFPGQRAFNAACGRGASVRALEYLLERSAPDWNEAIKAAARGGHLHVLQWMVCKRQDRRGPWRVDFSDTLQEAAAQGHLETVKWLHRFDSQSALALRAAASGGHLPVVEWLWGQGVRDGKSNVMGLAAFNGHLEVVQWLYEHGGYVGCAMNEASAGGYLEILKWLHTNTRALWPSGAIDAAAANGHLEVVKWLHANVEQRVEGGERCTINALVLRTYNGHSEVMKRIAGHCCHRGQTKETTIADGFASCGRLDALKWLHNVGSCYITTRTMDVAATNGHLDVVKWLHAYKKDCTSEAMNGAAKNGHLAVVEWLHCNRREGCTKYAMDCAAENGHLDVVCWLHRNRTEGCTGEAVRRAALNGHLEVVRWLYKVYGGRLRILDLMDSAALAARRGYLDIVLVFARNPSFSDPKYLTLVMSNAFVKGQVPIVEWLLDRGCEMHPMDAQWSGGYWGIEELETMKIVYKGSEVSVPDVRRAVMVRGDVRMVRWLWHHGCNTYTPKDFWEAAWSNNLVLTRWLLENGVRLGLDAIWSMFSRYDCLEVVEWVPESDRVWVVQKALEENEKDLEKVAWVLENVDFHDVSSRIAIRDAIHQAPRPSLQWIEAHLQNAEVRGWSCGSLNEEATSRSTKRQRTD